jgi:hypothetical protein
MLLGEEARRRRIMEGLVAGTLIVVSALAIAFLIGLAGTVCAASPTAPIAS